MYKSPIEIMTEEVINNVKNKVDEAVMQGVVEVGVSVDKDELIKALNYDRDQYRTGFWEGYAEGYNDGKADTIKAMERMCER